MIKWKNDFDPNEEETKQILKKYKNFIAAKSSGQLMFLISGEGYLGSRLLS